MPTANITQDWEPLVLHKPKPKAEASRNPKAVNSALRSGKPVESIKKFEGGTNKKKGSAVINARKLDEAAEPAALDKVCVDVRLRIQKARVERKMSQAELAKQINEQVKVVQDYESGRAVVDHALLTKMERVLGVKLRGKTK